MPMPAHFQMNIHTHPANIPLIARKDTPDGRSGNSTQERQMAVWLSDTDTAVYVTRIKLFVV